MLRHKNTERIFMKIKNHMMNRVHAGPVHPFSFPFSETSSDLEDSELKENVIPISVMKVKNPLNNDKISNLKNLIKSNKELLSLLRDLLKKRSTNNTSDILEIVKNDQDDFIKRGIFDDFNKLIEEPNANEDLLNELFNFNDASIFYKNLILMKALDHLDNIIKNKGNNSSEWRHLINELRNDDNE